MMLAEPSTPRAQFTFSTLDVSQAFHKLDAPHLLVLTICTCALVVSGTRRLASRSTIRDARRRVLLTTSAHEQMVSTKRCGASSSWKAWLTSSVEKVNCARGAEKTRLWNGAPDVGANTLYGYSYLVTDPDLRMGVRSFLFSPWYP